MVQSYRAGQAAGFFFSSSRNTAGCCRLPTRSSTGCRIPTRSRHTTISRALQGQTERIVVILVLIHYLVLVFVNELLFVLSIFVFRQRKSHWSKVNNGWVEWWLGVGRDLAFATGGCGKRKIVRRPNSSKSMGGSFEINEGMQTVGSKED